MTIWHGLLYCTKTSQSRGIVWKKAKLKCRSKKKNLELYLEIKMPKILCRRIKKTVKQFLYNKITWWGDRKSFNYQRIKRIKRNKKNIQIKFFLLTCERKAPVAMVNTQTRKYGDLFKPVAQYVMKYNIRGCSNRTGNSLTSLAK